MPNLKRTSLNKLIKRALPSRRACRGKWHALETSVAQLQLQLTQDGRHIFDQGHAYPKLRACLATHTKRIQQLLKRVKEPMEAKSSKFSDVTIHMLTCFAAGHKTVLCAPYQFATIQKELYRFARLPQSENPYLPPDLGLIVTTIQVPAWITDNGDDTLTVELGDPDDPVLDALTLPEPCHLYNTDHNVWIAHDLQELGDDTDCASLYEIHQHGSYLLSR